jgi:hypothetical protein
MIYVVLSTAFKNRTFQNIRMAELYAMENVTENCCVLSSNGKVLSFKRRGEKQFTRITKQADICT